MTSVTLLLAGAISLATGAAFAFVARAAARRPAAPENRWAQRGHVMWWGGIGAYLVLQGACTALAGVDALSAQAYLATRVVSIPLLCAAVWGITYYIVFLHTGRRGAGRWLAVVYALTALLFYYVTFQGPQSMRTSAWIIEVDDSAPLYRAVYVLVGLPPILASLAYLALLRKTQDPERRRRILLLGGSILAYIGSGLAARLSSNDLVIFVTLVLFGGAAALMSLAAYRKAPEAIA